MTTFYIKDPDATLDYAFDWTAWLDDGETITSHVVTLADGIVKDSDAEDAGVVTVWLSGGTDRQFYSVACRITTSASRTDERTITIRVRER